MKMGRRFTAILYLNEREWEESPFAFSVESCGALPPVLICAWCSSAKQESYAGAFRAFRSKDMSGGDSGFVDASFSAGFGLSSRRSLVP